jgi:hypothetical protein
MRFSFPRFPGEFEIPNEWWEEAGMRNFLRKGPTFLSSANAVAIPLTEIEPPMRLPGYAKDWQGFDRVRLVRLLRGFTEGAVIDAVPLRAFPQYDVQSPPFRYYVLDGYHRFYASVAVGFDHLPSLPRE